MSIYSEECLAVFLRSQKQLFDEPVAESPEEAEEFLEECMAEIVNGLNEVREYLDESGMDVDGLTDEELEDQAEVFPVGNGQYLIVEG